MPCRFGAVPNVGRATLHKAPEKYEQFGAEAAALAVLRQLRREGLAVRLGAGRGRRADLERGGLSDAIRLDQRRPARRDARLRIAPDLREEPRVRVRGVRVRAPRRGSRPGAGIAPRWRSLCASRQRQRRRAGC